MQTLSKQVAEIELIYKPPCRLSELPQVACPDDAYRLLAASWDLNKIGFVEQFKLMLLNNADRVLGICKLFSGGTRSVTVDVKLAMAAAIKASACNIIIAHNHPGGILSPSMADINMTNKFANAARLLGIKLLDHIILTREGFYSFYEQRMLAK